MKKNAVGLANICILSTMVLVTLSTTVCLYSGQNSMVETYYPRDVQIRANDADKKTKNEIFDLIQTNQSEGIKQAKNIVVFDYYTYETVRKGSDFSGEVNKDIDYQLFFIKLNDYNAIENANWELADNEILVYSDSQYDENKLSVMDYSFDVKSHLDSFSFNSIGTMGLYNGIYIVLPNQETFEDLMGGINDKFSNEAIRNCYGSFDYQQTAEDGKLFLAKLNEQISDQEISAYILTKESMKNDYMAVFGGLLFIGSFLGVLFIMATALIIYYKQISEGYEDRERFQIMQKVGLSLKEVKKSIRSQMLTVFFLPLVVAVIHVAGAFKMITKMLELFSLVDIHLFLICTLITILIFGIIYGIVYGLTAKMYYKIVR